MVRPATALKFGRLPCPTVRRAHAILVKIDGSTFYPPAPLGKSIQIKAAQANESLPIGFSNFAVSNGTDRRVL